MSDLVGNPEDRFSHNEAQIRSESSLGAQGSHSTVEKEEFNQKSCMSGAMHACLQNNLGRGNSAIIII